MVINSKWGGCEECDRKSRVRKLRKWKGKFLCHFCYYSKREIIRISTSPPKSYYKPKERREGDRGAIPGIKKITYAKVKREYYGMALSLQEKQFLFRKYIERGLSGKAAKSRVEEICNQISKLIKELREKGKSKENIQKRFLAELERYAKEDLK